MPDADWVAKYENEVLAPLNARTVARELVSLGEGRPVLFMCWEPRRLIPHGAIGRWSPDGCGEKSASACRSMDARISGMETIIRSCPLC